MSLRQASLLPVRARRAVRRWLPAFLLVLPPGCAVGGVTATALAPDLPVPRAAGGGALPARAADAPFRFLVTGHVYGDMQAPRSPARTLVAATRSLVARAPDLLLLCGDTYRIFHPLYLEPTRQWLRRWPQPVFLAIGNHDATNRAAYELDHGPTWGAFVHGGCLFVQIDTELVPWEIAGDQLRFLQRALALAADDAAIRAVFCYGHKVVFAASQRYFPLLMGCNSRDGLQAPPRFRSDVLPLLATVAVRKPTFWFAGDVGAANTLPCFFDRDPETDVCFVATGVGDRDADLVVEVAVDGRDVRLRTIGLTGREVLPISDFGVDAWERAVFAAGLDPQLARTRALLPP